MERDKQIDMLIERLEDENSKATEEAEAQVTRTRSSSMVDYSSSE